MLGCGGESTVTLAPGAAFGAGGPNQEAALAAALELEGAPVAAIFLDTDGSDGGTEHAGAIVDGAHRRPRRGGGASTCARRCSSTARCEPWPRSDDAHRHRPDRHQRQRPVRDRDRGVAIDAPQNR